MADNSWRWLQTQLVFATSLLLAALAGMAEAQSTSSEMPSTSASGMVGHIEVQAEASLEAINVDWRPLGPATDAEGPTFALEDINMSAMETSFQGEAVFIFAIGGSEAAIGQQLGVAARAGQLAIENGARVVLARLSPEFEVLAEVSSRDSLIAALNAVPASLTPSADPVRTLPAAFQYAVDTEGRKALFANVEAFPAEDDVRVGIVSAALARDIYLFPVVSDDSAGLQPFAEVTGGRLVVQADASMSDFLLGDIFGGQSVTLKIPPHLRYRLPGETLVPAKLNVQVGSEIGTFELGREPPVLSIGQISMRALQPGHWIGWLGTSGRLMFGIMGALSNMVILAALAFGGRSLLKRSKAPLAVAQTAASIPDVTLAPLKKSIGRKETCDYVLSNPSVSRHHANLFQTSAEMWVTDENSTNGTFIFERGAWVQTDKTAVQIGDLLKFGDCEVSVEELVAAVDLVPPQLGSEEPDAAALQRFRKPRRNPITGKIEEGAT